MKITRAILAAAILSGCTMQRIEITSWNPNTHAACTLSNDRGTWTLTTPGTASVRKSSAPLNIRCTQAGATVSYSIPGPDYQGKASLPMQQESRK